MDEVILRQIGSRNARRTDEPVTRGRNVIAVIGIDSYDVWPPLNNAVADAEGVRRLFLDELNFIELTPPLYNADASLSAINSLVQDELFNLLTPDDSLLLFFAGHGHTLKRSVGESQVSVGYLIPVGGRKEAEGRFSTWLKLDSFLSDLSRVPARHVMAILDACQSGFALGQSVTVLRNYERYNTELSRRFSRQVITSAQKDQPAHDNGPLPGHSLFTGALIEALKSQQVDDERKGFVTGSELGLYVQKMVSRYSETIFQSNIIQTPGFGSFALHEQGELVIDLHGATQSKRKAREAFEVAERVLELGQFTGDARRFTFAAGQYRQAAHYTATANLAFPEADLGLGRALFAAGQYDQAQVELGKLIDREGENTPADTWLFLGMAQAAGQQHAAAAASLRTLLDKQPGHPDASWVQAFIERLPGAPGHQSGRKLALLIGIDRYHDPLLTLRGCVNDVTRLMAPSLVALCGFAPQDVISLIDADATRECILKELELLATIADPQDSVLVYFSGHSIGSGMANDYSENRENVYLIVHDTITSPHLSNGISALVLHEHMQAIPAGSKTLILDTHSSQEIIELASQDGSYAFLCASDTAEVTYEWQEVIDGEPIQCGMFTCGLHKILQHVADPVKLTYREWVDPARELIYWASVNSNYPKPQNPYFIGLPGQRIFGGDDPYQAAFQWVQTGILCQDGPNELARRYRWFNAAATAAFATVQVAFGRAFFAVKDYEQSAQAYQKAIEAGHGDDPDIWRALGAAHLRAGNLAAAKVALEKYAPHAEPAIQQDIAAIFQAFERIQGRKRHVIIFLIGSSQIVTRRQNKQLKRLLQEKFGQDFGFADPVLEVRSGKRASHKAILETLQKAGADGPYLVGLLGLRVDRNPSSPEDSELRSLLFDQNEHFDIAQIEAAVQRQPDLLVWVQPERM